MEKDKNKLSEFMLSSLRLYSHLHRIKITFQVQEVLYNLNTPLDINQLHLLSAIKCGNEYFDTKKNRTAEKRNN